MEQLVEMHKGLNIQFEINLLNPTSQILLPPSANFKY
jgi:hypothetical protein